jgi:hypothetical protein
MEGDNRNMLKCVHFQVVLPLCIAVAVAAAEQPPSSTSLKAVSAEQRRIGWNTTMPLQVVPLIIRGEGWKQQIIIQNTDPTRESNLIVAFGRLDGSPWTIALRLRGRNQLTGIQDEIVRDSDFAVWMASGIGQVILEVPESFGPQELGMAVVLQARIDKDCNSSQSPVRCAGEFFGQSVFRKATPGNPDLMTTMPFSAPTNKMVSTFFDNEGSKYPGVGIVGADFADLLTPKLIRINLRIAASDGSFDRVVQRLLPNGGLIWFSLVQDFPETIGKLGRINVWCDNPNVLISGMSLQFAPNRAFTAISTFEAQGVAP